MGKNTSEVLTTGKIADTLGVSAAQVKKAIETLKIKPALKKGACSYYSTDSVAKITSTLKK